jgi:hypothetical protein
MNVKLPLPAMPDPSGPNPQKVRFFTEVAAAYEVLALFYALTPEEQAEFNAMVRGFAAAVGNRRVR